MARRERSSFRIDEFRARAIDAPLSNANMQFAKHLREPVKRGEVTCSVRVWVRPKVKVGGRYKLEGGQIVVDRIQQIDFDSITPSLARKSGFASVPELLRTAIHGPGRNVYLVEFHYERRRSLSQETNTKR